MKKLNIQILDRNINIIILICLIVLCGSCKLFRNDSNCWTIDDSLIHNFSDCGVQLDTVFFSNSKKIKEIRYLRDTFIYNYEYLTFHSNSILNLYEFYNEHGHLMYKRVYDKGGKLLLSKGKPIIQAVINEQKLKIGDTLEIDVIVAKPPNCEYEIYVIGKSQKFTVFEQINPCLNVHRKELNNVGSFVIPVGVDFYDFEMQDTIHDKVDISIIVDK